MNSSYSSKFGTNIFNVLLTVYCDISVLHEPTRCTNFY